MEKQPMFICKRDASGRHVVFEATPAILEEFVASTAKRGSQASRDACLMTLANGCEVKGVTDGVTWYRTVRPMCFAPTPTRCNLSGMPLKDRAYDAQTKYGGWCIMSHESWVQHGCGKLGTGHGQLYRRGSDGQFYVSESMTLRPKLYKLAAAA